MGGRADGLERRAAAAPQTDVVAAPGSPAPPHAPLTVRYCGGCNPAIDRVAVADEVAAGADAAGTLYVSGCVRACASGSQVRLDEEDAVVVAGEHVDGLPTAASDIAEQVKTRLKRSRTTTEG